MPGFRVRMTAQALADVDGVLEWLCSQGASAAASRWYARLMTAVSTLENDPHRCQIADEAEDLGIELRELHVGRRRGIYRILFRIDANVVHIIRVWHSARSRPTPEELN